MHLQICEVTDGDRKARGCGDLPCPTEPVPRRFDGRNSEDATERSINRKKKVLELNGCQGFYIDLLFASASNLPLFQTPVSIFHFGNHDDDDYDDGEH